MLVPQTVAAAASAPPKAPGEPLSGPETVNGRAAAGKAAAAPGDVIAPDEVRALERFIPVTKSALIDRLSERNAWPAGQCTPVRRFFRYLDYWRRQQYSARLIPLDQAYEPFSPDSDLLATRSFTDAERLELQKRLVSGIEALLVQCNYTRVDPKQVEMILTRESHYGLDLHVDLGAFDELLVYYRGASNRTLQKRMLRRFMRLTNYDIPIFQRLFVLFKLKSPEKRIKEVMAERTSCTEVEAKRVVNRLRALIPGEVSDQRIYMKLFKNMPRADIEMIFPNTQVRFRMMDKIKLGLSAGSGLGVGAFGAAGKIALAVSNPIAAAGAALGLGGIVFRQAMNFVNQRQRYMIVMAQNLYFHAMADNRGVMIKLADRAAEEDVKEEMLLYAVLAKETVYETDLKSVDRAIERYLETTFGVSVNFDIEDALGRLIADGLVTRAPDGRLVALGPKEAALHIDRLWDSFLDALPDVGAIEGEEIEAGAPCATAAA